MALFGKKDPCPICGGKVKGLLTWKIQGQPICDDCHGVVDLPQGAVDNMDLNQFKGYMAFREENNKLKEIFQTSHRVDFGFLDDKVVFDFPQRMMCRTKGVDTTVFKGDEITSFVIREDSAPLFEGSPQGLCRHTTTVRERAMAMAPMVNAINMQNNFERMADRYDGDNNNRVSTFHDIVEPFHSFFVDIYFNHPYWPSLTLDMRGPEFSYSSPDVGTYLNQYEHDVAIMEDMARSLMALAFPAVEHKVFTPESAAAAAAAAGAPVAAAAPAQEADPVEQIMRYKGLLDQGVISQEEFDAKKRQLMGF